MIDKTTLTLGAISAAILVLVCGVGEVFANNGSVAIGTPVSNIQVDGKFDDWPTSAKRFPLTFNHFGDAPQSDADLKAWFHVGYDSAAKKLYVAMEVHDDSIVAKTDSKVDPWQKRDSAGIYLAVKHGQDGHPVDQAISLNYEHSLTSNPLTSDSLHGVACYSENVGRFEWSVDLAARHPGFDFESPFTVAFCAEVGDRDEDGSFSMLYWSPMAWKQRDADLAGDLILGLSPDETSTIIGRIASHQNQPTGNAFGRILVRYASTTNPNLSVDVMTNVDGSFELDLPAGTYKRSTPDWSSTPHESTVITIAGEKLTDQIDLVPVRRDAGMGPGKSNPTQEPAIQRVNNRLDRTSFEVRKYTLANGIPNNISRDLVVDDQGVVWAANEAGLVKLSGNTTTTYTVNDGLPHSLVQCVYLSPKDDSLWIGTSRGAARLHVKTNKLEIIPELQGKTVFEIKTLHNDAIGFATNRGLFVVSDGKVEAKESQWEEIGGNAEQCCLSICADPSGKFSWIGTQDGVCKFDGNVFFEFLNRTNGLPDNRVWEIFADSHLNIWFGANRSIFVYDGDEFRELRSNSKELYRHCDGIVEDHAGRVWCQTFLEHGARGMVAYDSLDSQAIEIKRDVHAMRSDRSGSVWLLQDGSISQMSTHRTRLAVGNCQVIALQSCPISKTPNTLWFSVQRKTGEWRLRASRTVTPTSFLVDVPAPSEITSIVPHATKPQKIWVGTVEHGLLLFDSVEQQFHCPDAEPNWPKTPRVFCLRYHSSGDLWCGTSDGITVIRGDSVRNVYSMGTGLPTNRCDYIDECPGGEIVCGTYSGVIFLDANSGKVLKRLGPKDGLPDNFSPLVSAGSDGSVWIGTFSGLYRYKDGKVTPVNDDRGLLNSHIRRVVEVGRKKNLMVISDLGVAKMTPDTKVIQAYCRPTHISPDESFSDIAFGEGTAWIATSDGIRKCLRETSPPRVVLQSVRTDRELGQQERIFANTDLNATRLEFQKFKRNGSHGDLIYRYRLVKDEEHPQDWSTSQDSVIYLATPPPGNYKLEVFAYDRELANSAPLVLDFHVTVPYQRWIRSLLLWASLAAGVGFGVLYIANVVRTNRVLEIRVAERTAAVLSAQEEQQRLQLELLHAQKMESLGTMAAGMAHDFNNTLCAIACNAELGLMRLEIQPDRVHTSLQEVISATEQASSLTKSLLTFAGKSSSRRQPKDLQQIVKDAMSIIRGTIPASIQIDTIFDDDATWCDIDEAQLKQVVVNLSVNARDAMPNGGRLTVEVSTETLQVEGRETHEAVLRISDNGTGMKSSEASRIFEPFYTTKPRGKGTGLGLSMAHSIVSAHDGRILVESKPGVGTVFEIRLPASDAMLFDNSKTPMNRNEFGKYQLSGTVIIADDESRVRATLQQVFEAVGITTVGASDGEELVALAEVHRDSLALVVADVDMPKLDGLGALTQLREDDLDVPAIIITGQPTDLSPNAMSGPTAFLRKPFAVRELLEQAHRYARPIPATVSET